MTSWIKLAGTQSGSWTLGLNGVTLAKSQTQVSPYTLTLPENAGTSGQVLTTDGSGVLSWQPVGGGGGSGVGSIVAGTGITIDPITGVGAVTISTTGPTLPASAGNNGRFLSTSNSGAYWSSQIYSTDGIFFDPNDGRDITIIATAGHTGYAGYRGGSVFIQAGNAGNPVGNGGGGNIELKLGIDPSHGYFLVKNDNGDFFKITRFGSWGIAGENYGTTGQVLTSTGPNSPPVWANGGGGGGGGGIPGGADTQIQYNDAGSFGASPNLAFDKVSKFTVGGEYPIEIDGNSGSITSTAADGDLLLLPGANGRVVIGTTGNSTIQSEVGQDLTITSSLTIAIEAASGGIIFKTGSTPTEKIRFADSGAVGLNGGNYGTVGQVLTSAGPNAPPTWTSIGPAPASAGIDYIELITALEQRIQALEARVAELEK